MTTAPAFPSISGSGRWGRFRERAGRFTAGLISVLRSRSEPAVNHIKDHGYSITGFGLISAASFTHSVFTGLLVTGVMTLIFEWKVSD